MKSLLAAACGLAVLLASVRPGVAQPAPIEIDAILSLTGAAGFIGTNEKQALTALESLTNQAGGVRGRPISFVVFDDQSNPQVALQLATQILAKKPNVLIGPGFTATCLATLPQFRSGPLAYCLSPSIVPAAGSFGYSSSAATRDDALAGVRFLRDRGWTKIAIVTPTDASGQAIDQTLLDALALPENKSLTLVAHERFNPTDISITAQAERVKAANPQAVIGWAAGTATGTIFRGLHDAGIDVPVLAGNGNMIVAQLAQYAAFLPRELYFSGRRALVADPAAPRGVRDAQAAFQTAFKAAGIKPNFVHTLTWDPALVLIDALRKTGPDASAQQINEYVSRLRGWAGINGSYDFSAIPQRGIGLRDIVIDRWDPATSDFVLAGAR
jgi:branched-chain amino acid transport system substrate-binding protein